MKKKIFTGVVTAMMLVFTMGTTVFADPSPTSDTALVQRTNELNKATTVESSGYNANNELITVSSKGVDKDVYREGNRQANAVASAQNGSATVMAMSDISVPSATNTSKGIKVTICASGIKAGDNVYVLHKLKSGSWQTVKPDSVSNGKVTVTLYSFSPVIVVRYSSNVNPTVTTDPSKDENSQGSNTNSNVNDNSNSSSQTNNNNQNNSQTNNQYNPVSVNQNVTVNYPQSYDDGEDSFEDDYDDGYTDGYTDGKNSVLEFFHKEFFCPCQWQKWSRKSERNIRFPDLFPIRHLRKPGQRFRHFRSLQYLRQQVLLYAEEKHVRINLTGYNFI